MSPVHYANSESGARNAVVKVKVIAGLVRGEKNRSNKIYFVEIFHSHSLSHENILQVSRRGVSSQLRKGYESGRMYAMRKMSPGPVYPRLQLRDKGLLVCLCVCVCTCVFLPVTVFVSLTLCCHKPYLTAFIPALLPLQTLVT